MSKTFIPADIQATADAIMARSRARFGHDAFRMEAPKPKMPADQAAKIPQMGAGTFDECLELVRNGGSWGGSNTSECAAKLKRDVFACMQDVMDGAEGRDLKASEMRTYDAMQRVFDELNHIENTYRVDRRAHPGLAGPPEAQNYMRGAPLAKGQTFSGYAEAMGHTAPQEVRDACQSEGRELDLGKYLHGSFTGDWRDAEPERVLMALSGATPGAGGVMLPTVLTANIIDLARARTRVLEAGAQIVPMENKTVDVPRWLTDPTLSWRSENAVIPETDPTMDKITLKAKALAAVTRVSRELIEDTDIQGQLEAAFGAALALSIDTAALYGTGVDPQPTGVKNTTAVTKTPLAVNGATPTWAALVASVGRLRDVNEEPTAQIMADRTARTLALLADTTGQYVAPPSYLDGVDRLTTSQVPLNLTVGTSTDTSDAFTADWTQLLIGVRTQLQITLLSERYMADAGQYGFVAWWRGDIGVARPKAFDVVTGVRP